VSREPIESEILVPVNPTNWDAWVDGKPYRLRADVPKRCRRAWDCLRGRWNGELPMAPRTTGWWSYRDLVETTGHQCDERKLRELAERNPGLIRSRRREGATCSEFKVNPEFEYDEPRERSRPGEGTVAELRRQLSFARREIRELREEMKILSGDRRRSRIEKLANARQSRAVQRSATTLF